MKLQHITIKARLIGTLAFLCILLVVGATMGMASVESSNATVQRLYTDQMPSAVDVNVCMNSLLRARAALDRAVIRADAEDVDDIVAHGVRARRHRAAGRRVARA